MRLIVLILILICFQFAEAGPSTTQVCNYLQKKLDQDHSSFSIKEVKKCTLLFMNKYDNSNYLIKMDSLNLARLGQLKLHELYNVTQRGVYVNLVKNHGKPSNSFIEFSKSIKLPKNGLPESHSYRDHYEILVGDIDTATRIAKGLTYIAQSCGAEKEMF